MERSRIDRICVWIIFERYGGARGPSGTGIVAGCKLQVAGWLLVAGCRLQVQGSLESGVLSLESEKAVQPGLRGSLEPGVLSLESEMGWSDRRVGRSQSFHPRRVVGSYRRGSWI